MLGTFSKVVSPGMRIGWICCRNEGLRTKLLAYKMTEDLHTNIFCQMVLAQYLQDNDLDAHIDETKNLYKAKAEYMIACMFTVRIRKEEGVQRKSVAKNSTESVGGDGTVKKQPVRKVAKPGRNDPCPCGKWKEDGSRPLKYKECCGRNE